MASRLAETPKVVLWLAGLLIAAHVARFVAAGPQEGLGLAPELADWAMQTFAVQPDRFDRFAEAPYRSPLGVMAPLLGHVFLHGGFLHLLLNIMVFLQAAGLAAWRLEDREPGGVKFLALFFGSGVAGALAYVWINPSSAIPAVGASGAICGIFAAYLLAVRSDWRAALADPKVRSAGFWFLAINVGLAAAARAANILPIAWEAHLGGFLGGAALYPLLSGRSRAHTQA